MERLYRYCRIEFHSCLRFLLAQMGIWWSKRKENLMYWKPSIMRFAFSMTIVFFAALAISEDFTSEKALATALVAATSDEARTALLDSHPALVNVELRKALLSAGQELKTTSDFPKALLAFQLARQVAERTKDRAGVVESLINIGITTRILGDNQQALNIMQESLHIAEELKDSRLIARSALFMGAIYSYMGDYDAALDYLNRSTSSPGALNQKDLAHALNNKGVVNMERGNFDEALRDLERALVLREELKDKSEIASSLNNVAICYDDLGYYEQALGYYKKSLKLREELGDKANIANVLNNMGDYRLLGDYKLVLQYNLQSLALATELGDKPLMARALGNVGNLYRQTGDYDRALEYALKSLALAEELADHQVAANELKHVSLAYHLKGDNRTAIVYADRAVLGSRQMQSRQLLWTALEAKGRIHRALNEYDQARAAFLEAIAIIEDWRANIAGDDAGPLALFSEKVSVYRQLIDLLIQLHQYEEAWTYAERARARMLLDVLSSGRTDIHGAMNQAELEQEKDWNRKLAAQNRRIQQENSKDQPDQHLLQSYSTQLQKSRLEYEAFRTKLYSNHPELKVHRVETETATLPEIASILDPNTAVLEYVVAEDKSYIFLLTLSGPSSVQVEVHSIDIKQAELNTSLSKFREMMAARSPVFKNDARRLYELLIAPVARQIKSKERFIILPDEGLWELPFQVLISPEGRYLVEQHTISYAPSLSALFQMVRLKQERHGGTSNLLAVGNPSLGKGLLQNAGAINREITLDPLPEAEREVNQLGKLYGKDQSLVFTGDQARESLVKSNAGKFRVLHLATHGILNDSMPMYSQLVLSQAETGRGEDGLLEAREIMNLNFAANLVVLSACESARGHVTNGEGVVGLTWSLFVAGASTTIVSQWKVDSASTTELMLALHRNLIKAKMRPATALQQAELKLLHTTEYSHPFYWAGFVVIGVGF